MRFLSFSRFGIVIIVLFLIAESSVSGQTQPKPELLVTWRANTLYPSDYPGKAFPGARSSITASAEGYRDGKWIDTSRATFTWVLAGKVIGRGEGLRELSFKIPDRPDPALTLKVVVTLPEGGTSLEAFSSVPIRGPQVIINTPFPGKVVAAQSRFTIEASPYFWNARTIEDILFSWTANDTRRGSKGERAISLTVGTPANDYEKALRINALLQNPDEPTEFARHSIQIEIQ